MENFQVLQDIFGIVEVATKERRKAVIRMVKVHIISMMEIITTDAGKMTKEKVMVT